MLLMFHVETLHNITRSDYLDRALAKPHNRDFIDFHFFCFLSALNFYVLYFAITFVCCMWSLIERLNRINPENLNHAKTKF